MNIDAGGGTYLEYLGRLPVYYINVKTSTDRNEQWLRENHSLFHEVHRVNAVTGADVSDEMTQDFIDGWIQTDELMLMPFDEHYNIHYIHKTKPRSGTNFEIKRVQCALTMSHLNALQLGLDHGHDRFMVSEDDAVPRRSTRDDALVTPPPGGYDVVIHGGGFDVASQVNDSKLYANRVLKNAQPHRWRDVKNPFNAFCATMYEVSRVGAEDLIRQMTLHPMSFDHGWGFTLQRLPSLVAEPAMMVQSGRSDRMKNTTRTPII